MITTVIESHGAQELTGLSTIDIMDETTFGPLPFARLSFRPLEYEYRGSVIVSLTGVKIDMDMPEHEDIYINKVRVNMIKLKEVLLSYSKDPNEYNAMFIEPTVTKESRGIYMISLDCTLYHVYFR